MTTMDAPAAPLLLGAQPGRDGTGFGLFTTTTERCALRLFDASGTPAALHAMAPIGDGFFQVEIPGVGHGALYAFELDGRQLPDPYARFLPHGVTGPAMVVEPRHVWRHGPGVARPLSEHVIYELHVGTFSEMGTYAGVVERLPELAALGVTAIELMPVAAFAGQRGWGYDGVALYAPFAPYGTPDELRQLVDEAHGLGLSVLLDVVYNHFGPAGNHLSAYSPAYFSTEIRNAWGDAPDYGHPPMRRLVLENALYWLRDFRFDGLRLDAAHAVVDRSPRHVLRELADRVAGLSPRRLLIAEDDRNDPASVTELGLDAVWADDFHHAVRVTLTGERDGYYASYQPEVAELARTITQGWLYEGQSYALTGKPRGKPARALDAPAFVYCIQNHDQVGNRALGDRLTASVSIEQFRAVSTLLLFLPMTPMLFMGQEWAASSPFLYFTDHDPELGRLVSQGRREEFKHFAAFTDPAIRARIPDPQDVETFRRSRLRWDERDKEPHAGVLALHRALLSLRRSDPVLEVASRDGLSARAAGDVLAVTRTAGGESRLLLVNLGPAPAPLADLGLTARDARALLWSDGRPPGGAPPAAVPPATAVILATQNRET
jgi:maltooligosyltrehalose trehalohydrolase